MRWKASAAAGDSARLASLLLATAHGAADLALGGHLSGALKGDTGPEDLVADLFRHLSTAAAGSQAAAIRSKPPR
ncbi:MAG TPA: hypothetical protein VGL58_00435 [Caulobacteraceae bacterium]|jgi:hypothetical protein